MESYKAIRTLLLFTFCASALNTQPLKIQHSILGRGTVTHTYNQGSIASLLQMFGTTM